MLSAHQVGCIQNVREVCMSAETSRMCVEKLLRWLLRSCADELRVCLLSVLVVVSVRERPAVTACKFSNVIVVFTACCYWTESVRPACHHSSKVCHIPAVCCTLQLLVLCTSGIDYRCNLVEAVTVGTCWHRCHIVSTGLFCCCCRSVVRVCSVLRQACFGCYDNSLYMLLSNRICTVVDVLSHHLAVSS